MTDIRGRFRRSGRLVALYRGVRGFVVGPAYGAPARTSRTDRDDTVRELHRVTPEVSSSGGARLNLLIPTVEAAGTFGGIRTALDLFETIADGAAARRVVTMAPLPADTAAAMPGYRSVAPFDESDAPKQLTSIHSETTGRLAVGPGDVFVATFWVTAELAGRLRRWQADTFGIVPPHWAYIIQDYEPGFYPLSAQSELARATYDERPSTVAIFNTSLLRQAFRERNLTFDHEFAFEPRIPQPLKEALAAPQVARDRTILVYGRPRTPRNAFPAIIDGLRRWRATHPNATAWSLVSAGQPHPDVDLGDGVTLHSLGKLELSDYATLLRTSAIGVSFMISPHPSYPPLEMAHLGLLVLTNRYENKDLSTWHSNITSTSGVSAEAVADGLGRLCRRFEADPEIGRSGTSNVPEYLSDDPQFPFASDVAALLYPNDAGGPGRRT